LANAELRYWKKQAHAAFDPLWKSKTLTRTEAYLLMVELMDIHRTAAHIGMFDIDQCKKFIERINQWKRKKNLCISVNI